MNYCTECGHPLEQHSLFCQHCGAPQEEKQEEPNNSDQLDRRHSSYGEKPPEASDAERNYKSSEGTDQTQQGYRTDKKQPKQPMKRRTKILITAAVVLLASLFGTHKYLQAYFDPMKDLEAMDKAIANNEADKFTNYIDFSNDSLLDKDSYFSYIREHEWDSVKSQYQKIIENDEADRFTSTITDQKGNELYIVQPDSHILGLYSTYSLKAEPAEITIQTPIEETKIEIGDKSETLNANETIQIDAYPGSFDVSAEAENTFGSFTYEDSLNIEDNAESELHVDFDSKTYNFTTNKKEAVLFVDGEDTGKKLSEIDTLGPFPPDSDVSMHAEWTNADDEVLSSDTVTIDDSQLVGGIPFKFDDTNDKKDKKDNDSSKDKARETVLDFRADYENALNQKDYSIIESYLKKGSDAEDELQEYVGDLEDKGYNYNFTSNDVQNVEKVDDNTFEVTTREKFIFTNHKEEQIDYDRVKTYTVSNNKIKLIEYDETDRDEN